MVKGRVFNVNPPRMKSDKRLTALEMRCFQAISEHDGMSQLKGGAGCFAKYATMAEEVGTDVTNFSKAVSRLLKLEYIVRQPQLMDKRRFTLRVNFKEPESWRTDQQSASAVVGEPTNLSQEIVGDAAIGGSKVVGDGDGKNGRFSRENGRDYIPLNGELHSVETDEIDSVETAHFADRETRRGQVLQIGNIVSPGGKGDCAEAPATGKVPLARLLSKSFTRLPPGAMLQRWEEAFETIGRDVDRLEPSGRQVIANILFAISKDHESEREGPVYNQAMRLWDEVAWF